MATSPEPIRDHPLVVHLDPIFTGRGGHAPALAGWLEYLAHPEENNGPRVYELESGFAFERSARSDDVNEVRVERSVLRDLGLDRFFAHANVLSGQKLGTITEDGELSNNQELGTTFDLIEELRFRYRAKQTRGTKGFSADVWSDIVTQIGGVVSRENWDGGAGDNARVRYGQLKKWYENHRLLALAEMNAFLVKYASVLAKARADINDLMGKTVLTLEKVAAPDGEPPGLEFFVSILFEVIDKAVNFPKTVAEAAVTVAGAVKTVFDSIPRHREPAEFGFDSSDMSLGFYRFLESFIRTGDAVCHEATEAVHRLIHHAEHGILHVRRGWVPPPRWPH